jgi:hypothetical protein
MLQTASNTLVQGANMAFALARQNYITTTAGIIGVTGAIVSMKKHWDHGHCVALENASASVLKRLELLKDKLEAWRNTADHKAQELVDHLGEKQLSSLLRNANPDKIFQDAAGAAKTLEDKSKEFAARPEEFRAMMHGKARKWLQSKDQKSKKEWKGQRLEKQSTQEDLKASSNFAVAVTEARKVIAADAIEVSAIQAAMGNVKTKYELLSNHPVDNDLDNLADQLLITQFEEAGRIKDGDLDIINGAIDIVVKLEPFQVGINDPQQMHVTQLRQNDRKELEAQGLWKGVVFGAIFAGVILGLNHGLPRVLGKDHHVVQLLRLPS